MKNSKIIETAFFIIFIIALGTGAYYAIKVYYLETARQVTVNEYKNLKEEVKSDAEEPDERPADPEDKPDNEILPEYKNLAKKYPNFAGWLKVDGTLIDYPVMIAPEKNPGFYLDHSYSGKASDYGCLFIPEYEDYNADNIIIYGHNMARGDMFGTLNRYLDKKFFTEHPLIQFDTPYEHRLYMVFSIMKISVDDPIFHFESFTDWQGLNGRSHFYIEECVKRNLHRTQGTPPADGSKLLTLVTCEYTIPNGKGRYVVVAKDVTDYSNRPGTKASDFN